MFVSDEGFETLDLALYIRSTPTFLYFDFYNFIRFFGNDKLTLNLKKKKKKQFAFLALLVFIVFDWDKINKKSKTNQAAIVPRFFLIINN